MSGDYVCVQSLSCARPCDFTDCSSPGSSPWDFLSKNTGVGCHFLIQGIFLPQRSNPCLLHWQLDSLPLRHPRSLGDCGQFRQKFLKQPLAWAGLASPNILSTSLLPQAPFLFLFKAADIWGQVVTSLHVFFFSFWPQAPAVISSRIYNSEFSSFLRSCNG